MTERDDEAWRAIVENYGERASLDGETGGESGAPVTDARAPGPTPREPAGGPAVGDEGPGGEDTGGEGPGGEGTGPDAPGDGENAGSGEGPDAAIARALAEGDRFVPPPPPPLPYVAPSRLAAGAGVVAGPLALLVSVVLGLAPPPWVGYLLVAAFVAGSVYLVTQLKKRPDDPGDDGARV